MAEPQRMDQDEGQIRTLSAIVARSILAAKLGQSYGGNRDIYKALGYTREPEFDNYWNLFKRGDIAKRIVDAYPNACWRKKPEITESEDDETPFEKAWKDLVKERKVWHYLRRADVISGIGTFGVLFMGFDDVTDTQKLSEEVKKAKALTYLKPVIERDVQVKTWDTDTKSPRYGLPLLYNIKTYSSGLEVSQSFVVHLGGAKLAVVFC